ncbi:MAG: histidine phosphatase family protein [Bacilli bacterium]
MTTLYLIRHSVRMKRDDIETYNTTQPRIIREEKIILSSEGEKRAELLSKEQELQNIDVLYTSNCVRTLQTAKYMMESQNLKANIDERLDERRVGIINDKEVPDWFIRQYKDIDYKTIGGESMREVRNRFSEVIDEILNKNQNKRIAVFTHGYAITSYLLKYCKLLHISEERLEVEYNGKTLYNKRLNAPEVFKLTFDNQELKNIELIEFDDLPYNHGV